MKRKPRPLSPANLNPVLHCPSCWHNRTHWRKIEGNEEVYRCMVCGYEQRYRIKLEVEA